MNLHRLLFASILSTMAMTISSPSWSMPVMDLRIDNFMQGSDDIKKSLKLNSNQQMLWQQVDAKAHALLRVRQARRENLQASLKLALDDGRVELRNLAGKLDAEADLSNQEDKQLRELWMTMNDALDDSQRQMVVTFLADQLQRSPEQDREHKSRPDGDAHERGKGRQKPPGGGMGGGMQ